MSDESPTRAHEHELAVPPTVIHHPEEDQTLLARWLSRAIDKGPFFWLPVGGLLALIIGLAVFAGSYSAGESAEAQVWSDLILAKGADDQQKVADDHPDSPAADWALLHAAQARYTEGFQNLPNNRDAALPLLRQAIDLFQKAEKEASKDSPVRRLAAIGVARSLESRNELDDAAKQYDGIASAFPGSDEAKLASERAKILREPAAIEFYKDFSAFKPSSVSLPPSGRTMLDLPPMNGSPLTIPGLPSALGPESMPLPGSTPTAPGGGEFPQSVFEKNPPPTPAPIPVEPVPKSDPAPTKTSELPGSAFPSKP